jgi:NADH-quinone oxidoreductase subunit G
MHAHEHVSEAKPPEDPDSPLTFTMEGYRGQPPSPVIPFFWAPGWNSIQSVNKYQEQVGASLRHGDPGLRLLAPAPAAAYFNAIPEDFLPLRDHLFLVPLYHIFGTEELSMRAPAIRQRAPEPYVALSGAEAQRLGLAAGDLLQFSLDHQSYQLPVILRDDLAPGTAGLPLGLPGVPFADLPAWALITKQEPTWKNQPQTIS